MIRKLFLLIPFCLLILTPTQNSSAQSSSPCIKTASDAISIPNGFRYEFDCEDACSGVLIRDHIPVPSWPDLIGCSCVKTKIKVELCEAGNPLITAHGRSWWSSCDNREDVWVSWTSDPTVFEGETDCYPQQHALTRWTIFAPGAVIKSVEITYECCSSESPTVDGCECE